MRVASTASRRTPPSDSGPRRPVGVPPAFADEREVRVSLSSSSHLMAGQTAIATATPMTRARTVRMTKATGLMPVPRLPRCHVSAGRGRAGCSEDAATFIGTDVVS